MNLCLSYAAHDRDGDHLLEFMEDAHGIRWERCLDCGELFQTFSDTQGG